MSSSPNVFIVNCQNNRSVFWSILFDIFLIKLDLSGSEQWKKQYVNVSNDYVKGLTIDSLDNLYVSGYTDGGLDENIIAGGNDIFLIKFDSEGNKQ